MQHLFGLFVDKQGVQSDLRLLDNCIDYFLAQIITNTPLLTLENTIADGLAQVFQVIILTIADLAGQRIVKFGNLFHLHLV